MNKKAGFKRIVGIMILIVVLILLMVTYFTPRGLLARVSSIASDWSDKVLSGLMSGEAETSVDKTVSGEAMTAAFYNAATVFLEASKYQNKTERCVVDFSVLPVDFQDHKITTQEVGPDLFFELISPEEQILGQVTVEDLKLCAVYGQTHVPKFYNAWIVPEATKNPSNEYRDVNSPIKLVFDRGTTFTCENCEDLEDDEFKIKLPLLYKPTEDHVCFITTATSWGGCSVYETVVDTKCEELIRTNIPYCS